MQPKPVEFGELPKELAAKIVADMVRLAAEGREGFANPSQLGRTLGVSQPSARAWIEGRTQPSYKTAKLFSEKSGIHYPELFADEAGMKWRALSELAGRDHLDAAQAFAILDGVKFDQSARAVTWGDYYSHAKEILQGEDVPAVQPAEPTPPHPKKPPKVGGKKRR